MILTGMVRAERMLYVQQSSEHNSAQDLASRPCCRIAPLTGQTKTRSVSSSPTLSWTLLPPKQQEIRSTVAVGSGASLSATALGHLTRRKKAQNQLRLARRGPTGTYCARGAPGHVHQGESAQPKHG